MMKPTFHKGSFVRVRGDLDYLTLYVASGAALGLPDKEQVNYAGKLAKVFAVSSDGGKYVLCDPMTDKLYPGYWTEPMLERLDRRSEIDVVNQKINMIIREHERGERETQKPEQKKAFSKTAAKLLCEKEAYACIKRIAELSRQAYDSIKEGKSAEVIFHKIKRAAEEGENIGRSKDDEFERSFKYRVRSNLLPYKRCCLRFIRGILGAGPLFGFGFSFILCAALLVESPVVRWWHVPLPLIISAVCPFAKAWLDAYIDIYKPLLR